MLALLLAAASANFDISCGAAGEREPIVVSILRDWGPHHPQRVPAGAYCIKAHAGQARCTSDFRARGERDGKVFLEDRPGDVVSYDLARGRLRVHGATDVDMPCVRLPYSGVR